MSDIWTQAAHHAIKSKLAMGEVLILAEHHAEIRARLRVRVLVQYFEFRLNFFLRRYEELPDSVPFGQFQVWYAPLHGVEVQPGEFLVEDALLAIQYLSALAEAESSLASAAVLLLDSPTSWHPLRSNPIHAIGRAKRTLDQLKNPLLSQHPEQLPPGLQYDEHLWRYVETLTPAEPLTGGHARFHTWTAP